VSALTAKAKLAGMWREKVDQHNTGSVQYERIERVIVEHTSDHAALSDDHNKNTNDWLAAIDKIEELNPRAVVVGHGPLDPDNSPRHIQETRRCPVSEWGLFLLGSAQAAASPTRSIFNRFDHRPALYDRLPSPRQRSEVLPKIKLSATWR
jgi:hypothetical protein